MAHGLPSTYSVLPSPSTEDINQAPSTRHLTRSRCIYIVNWLYNAQSAENFRNPVWTLLDERTYAYYLHIIREPMDLTSVNSYMQFSKDDEFVFEEFLRRMRLIWNNCYTFNGPPEKHYVAFCAQRLQRLFETKVIQFQRHPHNMKQWKIWLKCGESLSNGNNTRKKACALQMVAEENVTEMNLTEILHVHMRTSNLCINKF